MPERPVYEVGFVLAGAVSAGCYSAGVMDFLIEALDGYYAARDAPGSLRSSVSSNCGPRPRAASRRSSSS